MLARRGLAERASPPGWRPWQPPRSARKSALMPRTGDIELDATATPEAATSDATSGTPTVPTATGPASTTAAARLPEVARERYTITGEVGSGGLGNVSSAHDVLLDRTVAIKELHAASPEATRRFVREALI